MTKPIIGWFAIPNVALTLAFFANTEGHVVGFSKGAVR